MEMSGAIIGECPICQEYVWEGQNWRVTDRDGIIHSECVRKRRAGVKWTKVPPPASQAESRYLIRLLNGEMRLTTSRGVVFDGHDRLYTQLEISHYSRVDPPEENE